MRQTGPVKILHNGDAHEKKKRVVSVTTSWVEVVHMTELRHLLSYFFYFHGSSHGSSWKFMEVHGTSSGLLPWKLENALPRHFHGSWWKFMEVV